jgi:putative SOS response-associated peptidase YedK
LANDRPIGFAGIWGAWSGPDGVIESCAVFVTDANELSRPIHARMPVNLSRDASRVWLDHSADVNVLKRLLLPFPAAEMVCYLLSKAVNNPRNNWPELIVPAA